MPPTKILVIDDDEWITRMVASVLEKRGYELITAHDGEEGLEVAVEHRPDLIIADVMMPRLDGWALIKRLRSRPEFALTPVVFLTALGSDEDRIRGFRLGCDDYIPKPFRFEELDLRVANALRRRGDVEAIVRPAVPPPLPPDVKAGAEAPASAPIAAIAGTLDQVGLPSVLMILEMERKTGVLKLLSTSGDEKGYLYIRDGRVIRAELDGTPNAKGKRAVYRLLGWRDGRFDFLPQSVQGDDEIGASTTHLLMEGARLLDESSRQ